MRQSQQNKRIRGRGRKNANPLGRTYESNGPDVKIRGTAHHIAEKYVSLSRDAQASSDRVMAENYLQHAEHYFRLIAAAQAQMAPASASRGDDQPRVDHGGGSQSQSRQPAANGADEIAGLGDQPPLPADDQQPIKTNENLAADSAGGDHATNGAGQNAARDEAESPTPPRRRRTSRARAPRAPRTEEPAAEAAEPAPSGPALED